jgi:phosphoribosyl-ATP pyrophosphohydrolase
MTLENLFSIITQRKRELPRGSYIAGLIKSGRDFVIQKVGEEAIEVVIAAKGKSKQRLREETADLFFMTLILLANEGITFNSVLGELEKRHKED